MRMSEYINALPDSYKKTQDSNNYKLLSIEQSLVWDFRNDIEILNDVLDIFNAVGMTLDLYGKMYNQPRGKLSDDQYRYAIIQKATRLLTGCDHESIVRALSTVFEVAPTSFSIKDAEQNCTVDIEKLPFAALQNINVTAEQAIQMIEAMLPAGVRLSDNINFAGTFEFAASASEYDEETGFGNIEQTIGGYFGYLSSDKHEIPK